MAYVTQWLTIDMTLNDLYAKVKVIHNRFLIYDFL